MRYLISGITVLLLGFSIWKGIELYNVSKEINKEKYNFAEINKIKYGLFNIDLWKDKLFDIVKKKADEFDFNANDFGDIKSEIEKYLYGLNKEYIESGKLVEMLMDKESQDNKLVGFLMNLFKGNIEDSIKGINFKAKIPGIADQMMNELNKKAPQIKKAITDKVGDLLLKDSSNNLVDARDRIYKAYGVDNFEACNQILKERVTELEAKQKDLIKYILIALLIVMSILLIGRMGLSFKETILWMTIACSVFLVLGIALPMIDLDARLSDVDLKIMGENIHFDEQVMYFQSKSIIDVTKTLLEGRGFDLKLVGILIFLFSIIFPFSKMLLTGAYVQFESARSSSLVKTVIFYLGKWSMADVFVVAIFMSYIGFYGILSSQLGTMASGSETVVVETVNYSKLSPGVIFFTLYCIFSIWMSMIVHRFDKQRLLDIVEDQV